MKRTAIYVANILLFSYSLIHPRNNSLHQGQKLHCKDKMLLTHHWECHFIEHLLVFLIYKTKHYLFYSIIVLKTAWKNQNTEHTFVQWLREIITRHTVFDSAGVSMTVLPGGHSIFCTKFCRSSYWVEPLDIFSHHKPCNTNFINSPNTTEKWLPFIIINV